MSGKKLKDLQELHRYGALLILDVSNNLITDASQVNKLPKLLSAKFDNNQIASMDSLVMFDCLQLLSLKGNQLSSPPPLEMPMLMYLNLDSNQLEQLPVLEKCPRLKRIEARANKITSLTGIGVLEELEEAHFPGNAITDLVLGPMQQLMILDLSENQISSLQAFDNNVSNLEQLNLSNNKVESVGELAHLSELKRLRSLQLASNPVAEVEKFRNHVHAILPDLDVLDGEPFTEEDREPPPEPPPPDEETS